VSDERAPLLVCRELSKSYSRGPEEVHALRGASLELSAGEIVGLVGPSGSGKTTLLNLIAGWEEPDTGALEWSEGPYVSSERLWKDLAIVPQALGLLEELSLRENVSFPLFLSDDRAARAEGTASVDAILKGLGLSEIALRVPREASLGEQQRAAVARALIIRPRLLLADEPTGHQDEGWMHGIFEMLQVAAAEGTTSLIATHNEEVLKHMDRVLTISDGEVQNSVIAPS
jgi:putative ABC transport system ATP-binding protein